MFAEDIDLLPAGKIKGIVDDCLDSKQNSYDLFGGLFTQMNSPKPATGGRFKGIQYFNGGLFANIDPIDLSKTELALLEGENGGSYQGLAEGQPGNLRTLFQHSMDAAKQHALGAHLTSEAEIQCIVGPTIIRLWRDRIDKAKSGSELLAIRGELVKFRVLGPACGSGNFLYVAFRE